MYAYTEEQAKQAIADKKIKDCIKSFELVLHERAKVEQRIYNLPYRVMLDYLHRDRDPLEIPLNLYYPFPGNKKPCTNAPTESDDNGIDFTGVIDTDTEHNFVCSDIPCMYDVDTEQGQQAYIYHMAVYILPYADKIPTYTTFDMFGDTEHTAAELSERVRFYMGVISKCKRDPAIYNHDIPRKHIEDYDKYDLSIGYLWDNDISQPPTAPNTDKDTALAMLHKELEARQAYYDDDLLGVIDYETDIEIIQDLITELETGIESERLAESRQVIRNKYDSNPLWQRLGWYMARCNPFSML